MGGDSLFQFFEFYLNVCGWLLGGQGLSPFAVGCFSIRSGVEKLIEDGRCWVRILNLNFLITKHRTINQA
jgi:hypothetical protein